MPVDPSILPFRPLLITNKLPLGAPLPGAGAEPSLLFHYIVDLVTQIE